MISLVVRAETGEVVVFKVGAFLLLEIAREALAFVVRRRSWNGRAKLGAEVDSRSESSNRADGASLDQHDFKVLSNCSLL